ncbi:MAG: hypothetical protein NTU65_11500 [Cyanobacteria bacterium]|nr:hypothetical protein [Cyanobacteriota bacterium]
MLASPSCPGLVPGRPYLQIDYARASWACDRLSSSALRCWLRLLTYFRNDRPIPLPTHRRLAPIAGVPKASARKALSELLPLVAFSQPLLDEDEEQETGPDTGGQKRTGPSDLLAGNGQKMTTPGSSMGISGQQMTAAGTALPEGEQKMLTPAAAVDAGGGQKMTSTVTTGVWPGQKMTTPMERDPVGEQKALTQAPFRGSGGQKMTASAGLQGWGGQKMTGVAPAEPTCGQNLTTPWSKSDQKRSENDQTRSKNDHPSICICIKEVEKKGITPPPTSPSADQAGSTASRAEEEGGPFLDNLTWSEPSSQANSQQPLTGGNSPVAAFPGEAPQGPVVVPDPNFDPHRIPVDRRLFEVGAELMHFWCGKPGPRNAMAFAVLQSELIQIAESPLGGIEAVREQLVTGVQKGWAMVKFRTWHSWRQSQPQPVLVTDEELDEGTSATGKNCSSRPTQRGQTWAPMPGCTQPMFPTPPWPARRSWRAMPLSGSSPRAAGQQR